MKVRTSDDKCWESFLYLEVYMDLNSKTIPELIAEEDRVSESLKIAEQNLRVIQNVRKKYEKNELTRRLCNHGRLLECFLPPDKYTDGQMLMILEELFEDPKTQEIMKGFEGIDCDVSHMKHIFY